MFPSANSEGAGQQVECLRPGVQGELRHVGLSGELLAEGR